MTRPHLTCPTHSKSKLREKRDVWRVPVLYSKETGTCWLIQYDRNAQRHILPLDPHSNWVDTSQSFSVPSRWNGTLCTIGVDWDTWMLLRKPVRPKESLPIRRTIRSFLRGGNTVVMFNRTGSVLGKLIYRDNTFKLGLIA